ncbi:GrpB family protein [Brevibacillus formosus]
MHHVGSTSVRGLSAKPVIDVLPVVRDIARVDAYNSEMLVYG